MAELYKRYRPETFADMVGNFKGFEALVQKEKRPHAYLFTGPSGTGKSSTSRILAQMFGAKGPDVREFNSSNTRGIDTIREIISNLNTCPLTGDSVVYIMDEFHLATNEAQNALLKPLEDTPPHVYFILCTSEPSKVINAIKTRCFEVNFAPIPDDDLFALVKDISGKEGYKIPGADTNLIVDASNGSARKALVILESVLAHPEKNAKAVISSMGSGDDPAEVMELCRAIYSTGGKKGVAKILAKLKDQKVQAENIRRAILGYGTTILLSGQQKEKAVLDIMGNFMDNTYDTGFPGVAYMCMRAMQVEETF